MSKPILHGAPLSPFVRKARVALAEKGVDYELDPLVPFGAADEYKKLSPLKKIPCWEEGDFALPDSSAIVAYLERIHPEPSLYPKDAKQFARALWYEEYADTKLAEVCTTPFFQRVVRAGLMKQTADEEAIQKVLAEVMPEVFDYLEGELDGREYLAGGQFSVADIAVGSMFVNFGHAGESVDASRWPRLVEYLGRVHGRPSYKAIIEAEKAALPS